MFQVPVDSTAAISQGASVLTLSAVIAYLIEAVKKSKYFPWISQETGKLNNFVSAVLSLFASWGVHASYDTSAHSLLITNLCFMCVIRGIWDWIKQYILTKVIYQSVISKANPVPVVPVAPEPEVKKV